MCLLNHSDSNLTPTQHRAAVAATGGKRAYPVLAWPTMSRLQKAERADLAATLVHWRDLNEPFAPTSSTDRFAEDGLDGGLPIECLVASDPLIGEDGQWGCRPSARTILKASCDEGPFHNRGAVDSKPRRTKDGWRLIERRSRRAVRAPWPQSDYFFFGPLLFGPDRYSDLVFLGIVKRYKTGSWKRPDGRWNLDRPGDTWRRPRGEGAAGLQGVQPPHYLNPGVPVLSGAEFIGAQPKSVAPTPANDNREAELELVRIVDARKIRASLGSDAALLDLAASPLTAEQIGERFGYSGQYARKWAVKAVDAAIIRFNALRTDLDIPQTRRLAA